MPLYLLHVHADHPEFVVQWSAMSDCWMLDTEGDAAPFRIQDMGQTFPAGGVWEHYQGVRFVAPTTSTDAGRERIVTLKRGMTWPLEQLAAGRAFSTLPCGGDVTDADAAATWAGPRTLVSGKTGALWSRLHGGHKLLSTSWLFYGCSNPHGLHLKTEQHCEMYHGAVAAVEVRTSTQAQPAVAHVGGSRGATGPTDPYVPPITE
jgi:hypothetical protein